MGPSMKGKGNGNNATATKSISLYGVIWMLVLFVLCFFAGLLLGSSFTAESLSATESKIKSMSLGLPGTNNLWKKWDSMNNGNLRSESPFTTPPIVLKNPQLAAANLRGSTNIAQQQHNSNITKSLSSQSVDLGNSLHTSMMSYMISPHNLDTRNILITAWIYLDASADMKDMRTIFSNKGAGCGHSEQQFGISLFVSAWQSTDKKLYAEYGGLDSGCYKIDSGSMQVLSERWYHVGVSFSGDHGRLYIDGEVVGTTPDGTELHSVQTTRPFIIGQYEIGQYPMVGNISHLVFVADPPSDEPSLLDMVRRIKSHTDIDNIYGISAHYSLADTNEDSTIAHDSSSNKRNGKYVFPVHGSVFAGVNIPLIFGTNRKTTPTAEEKTKSDDLGRERREIIKVAMQRVWKAYKQYSWGYDELKPKSHVGDNNWGGMGVTLVDSLDTLWLMGMKEEFNDAVKWVASSLSFRNAGSVSVFETTIRELGGLLSAYDLSGEKVLLDKASELGDLLMPAFNTASGIPKSMVDFRSHVGSSGWSGSSAILSELGSVQIEFRYLAYKTKKLVYETKAMKPLQLMHKRAPEHGLYPIKVNIHDGSFADSQVTFGALGDSFYEYLLKVWIQGGKKEDWLREMYDNAINGVIDVLLQASEPSGLAFLGDWNGRSIHRKMDHLVCFMPGTMALGAKHDPLGSDSPRAQRDLAVAKALMYTCREMYHKMESGISAEYVEFPKGTGDIVVPSNVAFYILRPETAESLFYLGQLTGDPIYREWAWEIWQSIDRHCRTDVAYGALRNVHRPSQGVDDRMESFFLAETIKYLYLAQDPDTPIDLDKYVFNTEAHPMKIFDDSHKPIRP